nr:MAG TPA: hypothetical protein [Caudoviricetes sp.]
MYLKVIILFIFPLKFLRGLTAIEGAKCPIL